MVDKMMEELKQWNNLDSFIETRQCVKSVLAGVYWEGATQGGGGGGVCVVTSPRGC